MAAALTIADDLPETLAPSGDLVLVLAPTGRDAALTQNLLDTAKIASETCGSIDDLCAKMDRSAGALIDERVLDRPAIQKLSAALKRQAEWSDFPIVVFGTAARSGRREAIEEMVALGNITILDRPVHVRAMVFAVQAVVRARQRQYQARRAIELPEQFLAMLGRELRNPLAAIRMAIESMQAGVGKIERQQAIIDRQSSNLARLVDDLLDVARVTHGKVSLQRTRVDVADVLRACFEACRPSANRQGHAYALTGAESPCWVDGDRLRLEQVFNNLLTNAIKYTPPGGTVTASLERMGTHALVRVSDTGMGIAPETLPHVFELFAQAKRSLDRAEGGLGLGLTVVQELVELHQGTVQARSDGLGHGSEFAVTLPTLASAASVDAARPDSARTASRTVVVVDDNDDLREMLDLMLSASGHDVRTAADGPSGVDAIVAMMPDVAFVDLGLPGFDGFEVARRVRAQHIRTRLVAVSGYGQPEDRDRAIADGFDEHLTKPVAVEQLEAVLRALPASATAR